MSIQVKSKREVYLDHAATTACDTDVVKAMLPYFGVKFGNPSSLYTKGREAHGAINDSRKTIAKILNALPENIIFTGSGTESDNLALFGIARAHQTKGKHIISTAIEHSAVLRPLEELQKQGFEVTLLKPNEQGILDIKQITKAIRPDTILISVMYANNEMGAVAPLADLGREILKYRKENKTVYPYFHTDACQAAGYLPLDVEKLHIDLMTINGSKVYGPKGIGLLYVRRGVKIAPLILGGEQEKNLRGGTENVPAIVGLAKALEISQTNFQKEYDHVENLSQYFYKLLRENISDIKLNGPQIGDERLPNNLNIAFKNIESEAALLYLSENGIMCSAGSACTASSIDPSHVLLAMNLSPQLAQSSLRFTLGRENTKADIDYVMKYLPNIIKELREINQINSK